MAILSFRPTRPRRICLRNQNAVVLEEISGIVCFFLRICLIRGARHKSAVPVEAEDVVGLNCLWQDGERS